jgi:hypothetical protein
MKKSNSWRHTGNHPSHQTFEDRHKGNAKLIKACKEIQARKRTA